jgi:hypothetical protein
MHNIDAVPRVLVLLYHSHTMSGTLLFAPTTGLFLWLKFYVVPITSKGGA